MSNLGVSPPLVSSTIAEKMQEGVDTGVFPGAVLLVAHQGKILLHEAYGAASVSPHRTLMRRDVIFDLASLTKPLATAAALLVLVQEGKLALHKPLSSLLPGFSSEPKSSLTLFHLLNHSSGLPDWKPYFDAILEEAKRTAAFHGSSAAKQRVYDMAHEEPLVAAPGAQSLYSDIGFMLLGEVIERTAGEPLHRFCHRNIFSKLKCKETTFIRHRQRPAIYRGRRFAATEHREWVGVISGRVHDDNAYAMGGVSGHAGLFSTAREVYLLVRMWLDSLQGKGLLDPSLVARFISRQKGEGVPKGSTWGLGWDTPSKKKSSSGRFFSDLSFGHLGFTGTSLWVDCKADLVVILLSNRIHPDVKNETIKVFRPEIHDLIYKEVVGE